MNVIRIRSDVKKDLRIGLFLLLISLVTLWFFSKWMGIGCLILVVIWGILFVFPRSPIRKSCWSASDRLSIEKINYAGFEPKGNRKYLSIYITLRALSRIKVEEILLSIERKKMIPLDWKSYEVTGEKSGYVNFKKPEWLISGKHSARLIVYTPYGYSKSEKFTIRVRD